ncbi:MAG: hypothetical protein RJB08_1011 [Actinomycetota bacterium]
MGLAEHLRLRHATGVSSEKWRWGRIIVLHGAMTVESLGQRALDRLDAAMDALVVPGYSRIGYALRKRGWSNVSDAPLSGQVAVVTGHTSGIGFAAAQSLRSLGADLFLVGRDAKRASDAADAIRSAAGIGTVTSFVADMGEPAQIRKLAEEIRSRSSSVNVLVHNAGALLKTRLRNSFGNDVTLAVHVYGPHLLTNLLIEPLRESNGRVITVASGGMYAVGISDFSKVGGSSRDPLELADDRYDGTKQYAIAKRVQVTLNEMWAERPEVKGIMFQAMHPGWVDTPGVANSIPLFRAVTKPILRSAEQGADTVAWLASADGSALGNGGFWCDRSRRPIHRLSATRRTDTPAARQALWAQVESRAVGSAS